MIYTYQCGDDAPRLRASAVALLPALLATVCACHTSSLRVTAPDRAPPPPNTHELEDASYDWHALLIAPFGSVLKDIPVALHEVLLFRDEAHGGAAAENASAAEAECYAAAAPAPRFVGRIPDEYLLCFRRDRLSRIQASVRLTEAEAPDVFAAACAAWLKNVAPTATSAEAPNVEPPRAGASGADTQNAVAPMGAACGGRDGEVRFRGRLAAESDPAEGPQSETVLSITLDSAPNP